MTPEMKLLERVPLIPGEVALRDLAAQREYVATYRAGLQFLALEDWWCWYDGKEIVVGFWTFPGTFGMLSSFPRPDGHNWIAAAKNYIRKELNGDVE